MKRDEVLATWILAACLVSVIFPVLFASPVASHHGGYHPADTDIPALSGKVQTDRPDLNPFFTLTDVMGTGIQGLRVNGSHGSGTLRINEIALSAVLGNIGENDPIRMLHRNDAGVVDSNSVVTLKGLRSGAWTVIPFSFSDIILFSSLLAPVEIVGNFTIPQHVVCADVVSNQTCVVNYTRAGTDYNISTLTDNITNVRPASVAFAGYNFSVRVNVSSNNASQLMMVGIDIPLSFDDDDCVLSGKCTFSDLNDTVMGYDSDDDGVVDTQIHIVWRTYDDTGIKQNYSQNPTDGFNVTGRFPLQANISGGGYDDGYYLGVGNSTGPIVLNDPHQVAYIWEEGCNYTILDYGYRLNTITSVQDTVYFGGCSLQTNSYIGYALKNTTLPDGVGLELEAFSYYGVATGNTIWPFNLESPATGIDNEGQEFGLLDSTNVANIYDRNDGQTICTDSGTVVRANWFYFYGFALANQSYHFNASLAGSGKDGAACSGTEVTPNSNVHNGFSVANTADRLDDVRVSWIITPAPTVSLGGFVEAGAASSDVEIYEEGNLVFSNTSLLTSDVFTLNTNNWSKGELQHSSVNTSSVMNVTLRRIVKANYTFNTTDVNTDIIDTDSDGTADFQDVIINLTRTFRNNTVNHEILVSLPHNLITSLTVINRTDGVNWTNFTRTGSQLIIKGVQDLSDFEIYNISVRYRIALIQDVNFFTTNNTEVTADTYFFVSGWVTNNGTNATSHSWRYNYTLTNGTTFSSELNTTSGHLWSFNISDVGNFAGINGSYTVVSNTSDDFDAEKQTFILGQPPSITDVKFFALDSNGAVLGVNESAFNETNLAAIEKMNVTFSITDSAGIDKIQLFFTANGTAACSLGNNQSERCYNFTLDTWIHVRNETSTSTFIDGTGGAQGDNISIRCVGTSTSQMCTVIIDEHYNPNVAKHYPFNFSDAKFQTDAGVRINANQFWKVELETALIPLTVDLYKLDFRVQPNNAPVQPINAFLCNSSYTTGDPAGASECQLVASKTPAQLQDDGTKFRGIFTSALITNLTDIKFAILTSDAPSGKFYAMKTYCHSDSGEEQKSQVSTDSGATYANLSDFCGPGLTRHYDSELNVNWFKNATGGGNTQFLLKIFANDTTGSQGNTSIQTMTWSLGEINLAPIVDIGVPAVGANITGNFTITANIVDPNNDATITNVSIINGTNTTLLVENTANKSINITVNSDDFENGEYNITVFTQENGTVEEFTGFDTHPVNITNFLIINHRLFKGINYMVNMLSDVTLYDISQDLNSSGTGLTWILTYNSSYKQNLTYFNVTGQATLPVISPRYSLCIPTRFPNSTNCNISVPIGYGVVFNITSNVTHNQSIILTVDGSTGNRTFDYQIRLWNATGGNFIGFTSNKSGRNVSFSDVRNLSRSNITSIWCHDNLNKEFVGVNYTSGDNASNSKGLSDFFCGGVFIVYSNNTVPIVLNVTTVTQLHSSGSGLIITFILVVIATTGASVLVRRYT